MTKTKGALPLTVPEIEKAKSLSALGRSYRAIGRELHRSAHAIKRVLTKPEVVAEVAIIKADLADLYESLTLQTLQSIGEDTIKDASLLQRATTAGIFTDKFRLLRGESTSNLNVAVLMELSGLIRRQDDEASEAEWQKMHTLTLSPAPTAPSPAPPARDPIPVPQPAKIQEPTVARVIYRGAKPIEPEDESVLLRGLRH